MSKVSLDDFDRSIISALSEDARISNRQLAAQLNVTEGTVRARLKRMSEAGLVRFTAMTNFSRFEAMRFAIIRIDTKLESSRSVAEGVAKIPNVRSVFTTVGDATVVAMAAVRDFSVDMDEIENAVIGMPGVRTFSTSLTLDSVKYNHNLVKILPTQKSA